MRVPGPRADPPPARISEPEGSPRWTARAPTSSTSSARRARRRRAARAPVRAPARAPRIVRVLGRVHVLLGGAGSGRADAPLLRLRRERRPQEGRGGRRRAGPPRQADARRTPVGRSARATCPASAPARRPCVEVARAEFERKFPDLARHLDTQQVYDRKGKLDPGMFRLVIRDFPSREAAESWWNDLQRVGRRRLRAVRRRPRRADRSIARPVRAGGAPQGHVGPAASEEPGAPRRTARPKVDVRPDPPENPGLVSEPPGRSVHVDPQESEAEGHAQPQPERAHPVGAHPAS